MKRSTTAIGPPQLGQRHSGCKVVAVEVSDSSFGGVAWRAAKHRGSRCGTPSIGEEAEVADADEALGEQVK